MTTPRAEETFIPTLARGPIAAGPRKANQELFREFEWMIDEHGDAP